MSHTIYSLLPKSYIKKSHHSTNEFRDVDNFLPQLRLKIVDCWNYKLEIDHSNGSFYKIKFHDLEKKFLKNSNFVIYIVNSVSEDAFKQSIGKLLKTCKDLEKLDSVIVLSLSATSFKELHQTPIRLFHLEIDKQTDNLNQWNELDNIFKGKFGSQPDNKYAATSDSIPIPIPDAGRKSPSKFKQFFNTLPAKFDVDKAKTLFSPKSHKEIVGNMMSPESNQNLPDINVSDIDNGGNDIVNHVIRRNKVDSTKLSLNSLFRKRSKNSRNSGISLNSSNSTGSGSQKSDSVTNRESLLIFEKEKASVSGDRSPVILTASLEKTVKHKAKIEIFKDKVIRSTSCLQSPKEKRSKHHIKDMVGHFANFSSSIMTASSDTVGYHSEDVNNQRKRLTYLLTHRGQSEPPVENIAKINHESPIRTRVKYYSWNEDSSEEKDIDVKEIKPNSFEITGDIVEPEPNNRVMKLDLNSDTVQFNGNICDQHSDSIDDENNDVFHSTLKLSNTPTTFEVIQTADIFNNNYSGVSFSTFLPEMNTKILNTESNSSQKIDEHQIETVSFNNTEKMSQKVPKSPVKHLDDPMESLDKLIKSIQTSCEEMRAARKSKELSKEDSEDSLVNDITENNSVLNGMTNCDSSVKVSNTKGTENGTFIDEKPIINEKIVKKNEALPTLSYRQPIVTHREMSPEIIAVADSLKLSVNSQVSSFRHTCHTLIRNPIIVSGIFAATTLAAPFWCSYIQQKPYIKNLFYQTMDYIFYSDVLQSIPNQIISTGRNSASAATNTIKRILF